ncbi:MAG: hypothetical protein COT43_06515 [Candidatus Marinimicrobia bacterium CG08_land_8_20_14_0_20_45_22]|nr:MAG: hypothetical protein COT43_06515 [Candidatus Marinimicrobia bacterium CG08_land_8_20_14_0_20_45_22]
MNEWIQYLSSNPIAAAALIGVLVLFIVMVLSKLIKWAIVSFLILALALGLTYKNAQKPKMVKQIEKQAEKIFKKSQKESEKSLDALKEKLPKSK